MDSIVSTSPLRTRMMPFLVILRHDLRASLQSWIVRLWLLANVLLTMLLMLANWGDCSDPDDCPWDLNGDDTVSVTDFLALLAYWGVCTC